MKLVASRSGKGGLLQSTALLFLLLTAGCGGGAGLTISVAASLGDAMQEIAAEFEQLEGVDVDLNLGGSNVLARQVELGAPVDLVVLAGLEPVEDLVKGGFISRDGVAEILENRLVVVAKDGKAASLADLASLASEYRGRISMADPKLAPAGAYAEAALQAAGVAADLEGRIIPALDVRAAVVAVQSGNAEFGIVYSTDALAFGGITIVLVVPADLHRPIIYPAAVIAGSDAEQLARRFLHFLHGDFASSVFRSHGFLVAASRADGR